MGEFTARIKITPAISEFLKNIEEVVKVMGLARADLIFANRAELIAQEMGLL